MRFARPLVRSLVGAAFALALPGCDAIFGLDAGTLDDGVVHFASKGVDVSYRLGPIGGPLEGHHAALDHDFALDATEVTVGQFQAWIDAKMPHPEDGADLDAAYPSMRWDKAFDGQLAHGAYLDDGSCLTAFPTPDKPSTYHVGDPSLPMTCVTWYEALAVCAFEGKRLPTNAEWQYAVQDGAAAAALPFTPASQPFSCSDVTYKFGGSYCDFPVPVGTATGATQAGVLDLGGSVVEWVWDSIGGALPTDLGTFAGTGQDADQRMVRGAAYYSPADDFTSGGDTFIGVKSSASEFITDTAADATRDAGFRCARTLD